MSLPSARSVAHAGAAFDCPALGHFWQCDRMTAAIQAQMEAVRQACAEAAFGQQYDNPRSETDHVYNLAAADCNRAIRALDLTGTSPRKETP